MRQGGGDREQDMNEKILDLAAAHSYFSAACFNEAWEYLEKADREAWDTEQMLRLCYASFYHWTQRDDASPTAT